MVSLALLKLPGVAWGPSKCGRRVATGATTAVTYEMAKA
jgi:hypothetical protein